jgi:hypothetical protein
MSAEAALVGRMGFDLEFVSSVGMNAGVLDQILDTEISTVTPPCGEDDAYDLTNDDCLVNMDDLQALVDFARGLPEAEFRYLDRVRGSWKLGDAPYATPVVVEARNDVFAIEPTYRKFVAELEANRDAGVSPDIVLYPANDGMLHAFALEDDPETSDTEEGEELWAWIPGYLLEREHEAEWAGRLVDLMLYGRTFLFDGSPVVEDVWIDADGDGAKSCSSVPEDCEWHRVVVVQQGKGGPVTLALDITDTNDPVFLWEQTNETDATSMGYTVGRPVIANIYDVADTEDVHDAWVAIWPSGRAVPYSSGTSYYERAEATLYMWALGDDVNASTAYGYQDAAGNGWADGEGTHPELDLLGSSALDSDGDSRLEYGYISAALAAVDADSDGDIDTLYFPISVSYTPADEDGGGPGDVADPGSSWMYKACLDPTTPGEFTWAEFFDPVDDGNLRNRPEVYYAATTSWHSDGSLGVYWGTGTPFGRDKGVRGAFFALKDPNPMDCTSEPVPITDCGANGVYRLDYGEGLTSDPIIYAGTVYFTTWVVDRDACDGGQSRLYGISYEDCDPSTDTDGDGDVDRRDDEYREYDDEYISGVTIANGHVYVGSGASDDASEAQITAISTSVQDPFQGTVTLGWMEVF